MAARRAALTLAPAGTLLPPPSPLLLLLLLLFLPAALLTPSTAAAGRCCSTGAHSLQLLFRAPNISETSKAGGGGREGANLDANR